MRRVDAKKSKAGQYYLTHEEVEDLEKMRQKKRRKSIRRQPVRRHVVATDGRSLRELGQIAAIAVLVLLVLYLVL